MRNQVLEKLNQIALDHHVRILFAAESGSRAWGFASADSDFDVRFIYARELSDYLKLEKQRDVIELPVDAVWDINGWDLKKALKLLHDGNPTLLEWLHSPIIYKTSDAAEQLLHCSQNFNVRRAAFHYLKIAENVYAQCSGSQIQPIKYLYVMRGLLACQWILEKACTPPVRFTDLMTAELNDPLSQILLDLMAAKQQACEKDTINRIEALDLFIESQLIALNQKAEALVKQDVQSWEPFNDCFMRILQS